MAFLLEEGFGRLACGSDGGGSCCPGTETVDVVLCNSGAGRRREGLDFLDLEGSLTGDFSMTRFADFAELGVMVAGEKAGRVMCDKISGLEECEAAESGTSDLAPLEAGSSLAAGEAGVGSLC